jgi:hypothetical protein
LSAQRTEWSLVRWTGMTHCASFSGMEQFGSELGEQSTVSLRRLFLKCSCNQSKI